MDFFTLLAGVLQPSLAGYALRLHRSFGSRHVGWWVFCTFAALTFLNMVHLFHASGHMIGLTDLAISLLLLVGMAHTESFYSGRVRQERKERDFKTEIERLTRQNEELNAGNTNLLQQLLRREQRIRELSASEHQLQLVFAQHPQPMWIFDLRSLRFLAINEATLSRYGFNEAEMTSRTAGDLYAPEDLAAFRQDCSKPAAPNDPPRLWRHQAKDGQHFHVILQSLDLHYNECPARLVVASDVS